MVHYANKLPWLIVLSLGLSVFILVLLTVVYSSIHAAREIIASAEFDETLSRSLDAIASYLAVSASAVFGWIFMQVFVLVAGFSDAESDDAIRFDRAIASFGAILFVLHLVAVILTYVAVQKLSLDCSKSKELSFVCDFVKKSFESLGQKIITTLSKILIATIVVSAAASVFYIFGSVYLFIRPKKELELFELPD